MKGGIKAKGSKAEEKGREVSHVAAINYTFILEKNFFQSNSTTAFHIPPYVCRYFMSLLSLSVFVCIMCMLALTGSSDNRSFGFSLSPLPHGVTSCESKPHRQRSRCNSARLLRWSVDNYIIIQEQTDNAAKMTRQQFHWRSRCGGGDRDGGVESGGGL